MKIKFKKNILLILLSVTIIHSCKKENKTSVIENSNNTENKIKKEEQKKNDNLTYLLNENLTYKDLLKQKKYERLSRDKNYSEYIKKLWETNIKFNKGQFSAFLEIKADLEVWGGKVKKKSEKDPIETKKKLFGLGKLIGKSLWKGAKGIKNTYGMVELENQKKELYSSFSSQKQKIATDFEKNIFKIIQYSCNFPKNPSVKEGDIYQNFKSFNESLKNDEEVYDYLEPISENVENFLLDNVNLKSKLMLNKILNKNQDNNQLEEYGNKILLSNGSFKVKVKSELLEDFYEELNNITKSLNKQSFEIPVEDWSDEKQENFHFIINDIKLRLKKEVKELNI